MSCLLYFPRRTINSEGLLEELFRDCVKRKEEKEMIFLSLGDFIRDDNGSDKVISSYFKEVKIKELRIWKGDMRSCQGTVSDDRNLLSGEEPRKKNFQELRETFTSVTKRETKTLMKSSKSFKKEDSS